MKHKIIVIIIVTMMLMILTCCARGVEDYPAAVQWNDNVYLGSGDFISEAEIGDKIGMISKNLSTFPKNNGEANAYPAGSNIYEIRGFSSKESIAIEDNGQYRIFNHH